MKFKSLLFVVALAAPFAANAEDFDLKASVTRGQAVYMQTCFTCHQPTGQGLPAVFPPLAGAEFTTGSTRRLVAILLKGVQGPITVKGVTFSSMMPAPETTFPILKDDAKLADVANYVRNSFGNTSTEAVTPALVAELRTKLASKTTPYSEAELKDWKDDATTVAAPDKEPAK